MMAAAFMLIHRGAGAQDWPVIALPRNVQNFDVGQQITANGLPMRIQGFVSSSTPAQLAQWFRQSLGKPLMENTLDRKLILGRAQGEHYLTVQIEQAGNGSRCLVAVTHLKAAYDAQAGTRSTTEQWLSRLPSGSRLLSHISSQDGAKLSRHLVITNPHGETLNHDWLVRMMADDGFALEREGSRSTFAGGNAVPGIDGGKTLYFKGNGKEAMATIHRAGDGNTALVLNIVHVMERFK